MKGLNKIKMLVYLIVFTNLIISCKDENNELRKTTDFVPEVNNYNFYIEGAIEDKLLHYKQINYEWTNVSNMYFTEYEETWLQAFSDSLNDEGAWRIRFHDMNIETIQLPYTLKQSEGSITWFDSRIDLIIQDTDFCHGPDNGCTFYLGPERGEISITKVDNQIIEGNFNGRAIVIRSGFTSGQDESLYHDIENGKFRIKYRVE